MSHHKKKEEEKRMKNEGSVRTERFDEWGNKKGISERFCIKYFIIPGFFQKDAQGSGRIDLIVANEIPFRVFQVQILSYALGHGIVNGLIVEKKTLVDGGKVGRYGKAQEEDEDQKNGDAHRVFFVQHTIQQYHRKGKNSTNPVLLYACLFLLY